MNPKHSFTIPREETLKQARARRNLRITVAAPRRPLREAPVIVVGPTEGYCVVSLGFAQAHELEVVK